MGSVCGVGFWGIMEEAWEEMKQSISLANRINKTDEEVADFHEKLKGALHSAVSRCRVERKRKSAEAPQLDLSDESMLRAAQFTDNLPLADYAQILHLVPRLVNVVTCAPYPQHRGAGPAKYVPCIRYIWYSHGTSRTTTNANPWPIPQIIQPQSHRLYSMPRPAARSRVAILLAQVGGGRPRARQRAHAATEPARHRRAVHECVLRTQTVRRCSGRLR